MDLSHLKIINITLIVFLSSFTTAIKANTAPSYCTPSQIQAEKAIKINGYPSYFFKVSPDGRYLGYIDLEGNKLLNLEDGTVTELPGSVDPVFSPDGKYLVVPMFPYEFDGNLSFDEKRQLTEEQKFDRYQLSFYKLDDLSRVESEVAPYRDGSTPGTYQSIGMTKDDHYKIITDHQGVTIRNYKVENNTITPTTKLRKICENIKDFPTDLPMLSKDGKFISVFDEKGSGTTKIFQLNQDDSCQLSLDLGVPTGKVAFNYETNQIAFHMDHFKEQKGAYPEFTGSDTFRDIYTLKLEAKLNSKGHTSLIVQESAKLSSTLKAGDASYYPEFDRAGNIYYLQDQDDQFQFIKINKNDINYKTKSSFTEVVTENLNTQTGCLEVPQQKQHKFALAQLWGQVCQELEGHYPLDQEILSLNLSKENCEELITKEWNQKSINIIKSKLDKHQLDFLSNITINGLIDLCPKKLSSPLTPIKEIGSWNKDSKNFNQIIQQKCISCHAAPMEFESKIPAVVYFDEEGNILKQIYRMEKVRLPSFYDLGNNLEAMTRVIYSVGKKDPTKRMPKNEPALSNFELQTFLAEYTKTKINAPLDHKVTVGEYIPAQTFSDATLADLIKKENIKIDKEEANKLKRKKLKRAYKAHVSCLYQQKRCSFHIKKLLLSFEKSDQNPTAEQIKAHHQALKCEYDFEVIVTDCP